VSATARAASSTHVRRATPRDLDRLVALWTAIAAHHASLEPIFALRRGAESELRALIGPLLRDRDAGVLVFEADGDLRGLCIVRIDRAPPIFRETQRAEITDLIVREDHRRRGIGSQLVGAAFEWMRRRGIDRVEVRVAARNREGQAFWRARGFDDLMDVLHRRL
jgi:ribosomal protein S18 acetylase RimI-like enzyme